MASHEHQGRAGGRRAPAPRTIDDRVQLVAGLIHHLERLTEAPTVRDARICALRAWYAARDLEVLARELDGDGWQEVVRVLRTRRYRRTPATAASGRGMVL